jgi:hypothetical protein
MNSPLFPTQLGSRNEQQRDQRSSSGPAELYQMDSATDKARALELLRCSPPHIVRVVGSLPTADVVRKVRKALVLGLSGECVGPILIGGTESHKKGDVGSKVDSIPGIASHLRALEYQSGRYGLIAPIFGTIPVNAHSNLSTQHITSDSLIAVRTAHGLPRALIFPTDTPDLWEAEAYGVRNFVADALKHPGSRISVVLAGGGKATELECNLMRDLAREFPGQVSLLGFAGSGGVTDTLIKQGHVAELAFKADAVKRHLRQYSSASRDIEVHPMQVDLHRAVREPLRAILRHGGGGRNGRQFKQHNSSEAESGSDPFPKRTPQLLARPTGC